MNRQPDDFEALMEESLHTYANPEPRPSLEERILTPRILHDVQAAATAPASQPHPLRQYWGWLAATAAAATLAAILFHPHPAPRSETSILTLSQAPSNPVSANPVSANPVPANPIASPPLTAIRTRHNGPLRRPRLSQPATTSLAPTPQEKLLAQFVYAHRSEALIVAKAQAALDQPITVRPLAIQPIQALPIESQPISSEPIAISSIQIDSLDHSNPTSF